MTSREAARKLGVSEATLRRARQAAKLPPRSKSTGYSAQEVAQLRAQLSGKTSNDTAQHTAHTERKPERNQEHNTAQNNAHNERNETAELRARIERLEAQLAAQDTQFSLMVQWGTKAALAIRELWRRMPDYAPGATPGEFPAITLDAIGREELALQREEDRKTREFFERFDQQ